MSYYNPNLIEVYDIECYPNIFTYTGIFPETGEVRVFEVSERRNDITALREYLKWLKHHKFTQVGFNNVGYDYPVIHEIMTKLSVVDHLGIYQKSHAIINSGWNNRFRNIIPEWQREIPQLDLFLINHFDNQAKSTSLKMLEFVMRVDDIQDLPFVPEVDIPVDQFDNLIKYNIHDVNCTIKFYRECQKAIQFRNNLSEKYGKNFMNHNDTKIGKDYFIMELEKAGVKTRDGNKQLIQTFRDYIDLGEIILPYIKFEQPEFNRVLNTIKQTRIVETKGALALSAVIDGFSYDFGLGGIHGSLEGQKIESDDEYMIIDLDVASYYPNLAIKNRFYPEHLSERFCDVYEDVYKQRKSHAKGTPENAAMKLALNGVYGDSNSAYSAFYDSKFTMSITVNGQLLLCMLAEELLKIPNLTMMQVNTDGLTVKIPRIYEQQLNKVWKDWEQLTGLELEAGYYSMMAIRDVNNYIAIYENGGVKYNGAYDYKGLGFHQNHSTLVVRKAACAAIIDGVNVRDFIINHDDVYDFFLCTKVKRADSLILKAPVMWGELLVYPSVQTDKLQNITRYYVSNNGKSLVKVSSPLKRRTPKVQMYMPHHNRDIKKQKGLNKNLEVTSQHEYDSAIKEGYKTKDGGSYEIGSMRETGIDKDWLVTPVNTITPDLSYDINYEYYITEAEKLVNKIL